jgi:hypothetical protein
MATDVSIQSTGGGGEGGRNGPKLGGSGHGASGGIREIEGGRRGRNAPQFMPSGLFRREMINDAEMRTETHHVGVFVEPGQGMGFTGTLFGDSIA